jgi:bifunctional UDP-N-acetylglucosamine pyrophosphorylase / glucosamine-1-phosphate N-acetyltransferase
VGRSAIVLAAGFGTRMKSKLHKVLHPVCGKPMILHILDQLEKLDLDQIIVVVGQQRESVEEAIAGRADIVIQDEQLGTGHAVMVAVPQLQADTTTTVVLYGDAPLIQAQTIERLFSEREKENASAVVLTANVKNPTGLGRVFLDTSGQIEKIVEEKDASPTERMHAIINTGIYAFSTEDMKQALEKVKPDNAQNEYYLTDTIRILRDGQKRVISLDVGTEDEIASVNDRVQLAHVERIYRRRILERVMRSGVTILDPETTYVSEGVEIGQDTVLYPGTVLEGATRIGTGCTIGPNTKLVDTVVGDDVSVVYTVALSGKIGEGATVGPFAYLRPGADIGKHVKIGDFVEVKNSSIDDGSKVSHLAYVGDATIGKNVNVGCGVITVNYDGKDKHRTVVLDNSFIGSNVNLIAPVSVGEGAYVCAGSTVTDNVPDDGFAIGRARQVTKPEYVRQWRAKRVSAQPNGRTAKDVERR